MFSRKVLDRICLDTRFIVYLFLSLITLFLTTTLLVSRTEAAAYATGGEGKYKDLILWMTWGGGVNGAPNNPVQVGAFSTINHPLPGGNVMAVNCTVGSVTNLTTPVSPVLDSYRPGTYWGDGINHLYNIGGPGGGGGANAEGGITNDLIIGLTNPNYGDRIQFTVNCLATINGNPMKIPGLIVADAESMAAAGEHIYATAAGSWHVIEVRQNLGSVTPYSVQKVAAGGGNETVRILTGSDARSGAVAFLKLTTPSNVVNFSFDIDGGGHTAVGLGLLVPYADFGDVPQSYGDAFHLIQDVDVKDDGVTVGGPTVNFNNAGRDLTALGLKSASDNYLGSAGPDAEAVEYYSNTAAGDESNGFGGTSEEDAWTATTLSRLQANNTYSQTLVCAGTAYVAGWIDFNRNGVFDATERSTGTPACAAGQVTLSWNLPSLANFSAGQSYVRLRLATNASELASPTGLAEDGEVEDHSIELVSSDLSILKTSNATGAGWYAGQSGATYTLTVNNNGQSGTNDPAYTVAPANNAFKTVTVYDTLPEGISPNWTGTLTSGIFTCTYSSQLVTCQTTSNIAAGGSASITLPVTVTKTDNGSVINYASVGGGFDPYNNGVTPTPNNCTPATDNHCVDLTVPIVNSMVDVVKTASPSSGSLVIFDDAITYTLTVTVTERDLASDLVITDILPSNLTFIGVTNNPDGFIDTYATNNQFTLSATPTRAPGTYSISFMASVNYGLLGEVITNTATVTGGSSTPPTCSSCETTHIMDAAMMTLEKTASLVSTATAVGDQIRYTFSVTNTGLVQIDNVTITDTFLTSAGITIPDIGSLVGGETKVVDVLYSLTAADFAAQKVDNTATAQGFDRNGHGVVSNDSSTSTPLVATNGLALVKTAGALAANVVGTPLEFTFTVTNTGNTDVTQVVIDDPMLASVNITVPLVGSLAVGQSKTVSATYILTQADVDNGYVTNTADAEGIDPDGGPVVSTPSTTTTPITSDSLLELKKTAGALQGNGAGSTIEYTFVVTNTGTTTLNNVVVVDSLLANARVDVPAIGTLLPAESKTVNATYVVTQADVDHGLVENIALAQARNPSNGPVVSNTDTTRTFISTYPELQIKKSAYAPKTDTVGDLVEYRFEVSNTGNVTITNIVVDDPMLAAAGVSIPAVGDLTPGQSRSVIATYQLTVPDFDRGYVENVATTRGKTPENEDITSPPSEKVIYLTPRPELSITKVLRAGPSTVSQVGQVLTYEILVKNIGTLNLTGITVTDILDGEDQHLGNPQDDTGQLRVLEVDEVWRFTTVYVVTQQDLDSKTQLRNVATARSTTRGVNTPPPAEVIVPIRIVPIEAINDIYVVSAPQVSSPITVGNALDNDSLDNTAVKASQVTIKVITPASSPTQSPVPYLDTKTGDVIVPAGTDSGTYNIKYLICELYNPNNCAEAVITVTIQAGDITADNDSYKPQDNLGSTPLGNILDNDRLRGQPATPSTVIIQFLSSSHPALRIDETTGLAYLEPNAPAGEYTLQYRICDRNMPNHCAYATVTTLVDIGNMIRLSKQVIGSNVKVGDIVRYSVKGINQSISAIDDFEIIDTPPAGFTYVENSLRVYDRDGVSVLQSPSPLRITHLSVAQGSEFTITYALRVGPGAAKQGDYTNRAYATKGDTSISNTATATVTRIVDPLLEESRILGSVFIDRDRNGLQASAKATNVTAKGGFAPEVYVPKSTTVDVGQGPKSVADASAPLLHGLTLGTLSGVGNTASLPVSHIVISQVLTSPVFTDDFILTTAEGTEIVIAADGTATRYIREDVLHKRNVQNLRVSRLVYPLKDGNVRVDYVIRNVGEEERGLPGVRVATVEGLVSTTDAYGRFHIEGFKIQHIGRGKNIIAKVDAATLPNNAKFTTPNPLIKRVTQGIPARFDFGVDVGKKAQSLSSIEPLFLDSSLFEATNRQLSKKGKAVLREHLKSVTSSLSTEPETVSLTTTGAIVGDDRLSWQLARSYAIYQEAASQSDRAVSVSLVDGVGEVLINFTQGAVEVLVKSTSDSERLVSAIQTLLHTEPKLLSKNLHILYESTDTKLMADQIVEGLNERLSKTGHKQLQIVAKQTRPSLVGGR